MDSPWVRVANSLPLLEGLPDDRMIRSNFWEPQKAPEADPAWRQLPAGCGWLRRFHHTPTSQSVGTTARE